MCVCVCACACGTLIFFSPPFFFLQEVEEIKGRVVSWQEIWKMKRTVWEKIICLREMFSLQCDDVQRCVIDSSSKCTHTPRIIERNKENQSYSTRGMYAN